MARGADLSCKDRKGYGLLHTAAASGQIEVVKYLLRMGAEVRAVDTGSRGRTRSWRSKSVLEVGNAGHWYTFGRLEGNGERVCIRLTSYNGVVIVLD